METKLKNLTILEEIQSMASVKLIAQYSSHAELKNTIEGLLPTLFEVKKKGDVLMLLVVPNGAPQKFIPTEKVDCFHHVHKAIEANPEGKGVVMVFMEEAGASEEVLKKILSHSSLCRCQKAYLSEGVHLENKNLTKREKEILLLLETPISQKDLAKKLFISISTLRFHIQNIYRKLNVKNRVGAILEFKKMV